MDCLFFSKESLRLHFKKIRNGLSPFLRDSSSKTASAFLSETLENKGYILSYMAIGSELSLYELNCRLADENRLALPRVTESGLEIHKVSSLANLKRSSWNLLEPDPSYSTLVPLEEISSVLIPGLSFDSSLQRIGYGKGHYDRLLTSPTLQAAKRIGVGFNEQFYSEKLPSEPHDQPLSSVYLF